MPGFAADILNIRCAPRSALCYFFEVNMIEIGTTWRHKHISLTCTVVSKVFYNVCVEYHDRHGMPSFRAYWHYKMFLKHWEKI